MKRIHFSKRQIIFVSCISGILPAAYLMSYNFLNLHQKRSSWLVNTIGYVLAMVTYFLLIFLAEKLIIETGIWKGSRFLGYSMVVLLMLFLQGFITFAFMVAITRIFGDAIFRAQQDIDTKKSWLTLIRYSILGIVITSYLFIFGPFLFFFAVIYMLPNVYLYGHISKLFDTHRFKWMFSILFIALVAMFPLSELAIHNQNNVFIKLILLIGYYYTPLLLYSVLLYLLFDVLQLGNMKFKFISEFTLKGQRFRTLVFIVILLTALIVEARGIYNFHNTTIREYAIELPKKSGNLERLTIAMAADFHFSEITNDYFVKQFIERLNALKPDVVFFAGDIVESNPSNEKMDFITDQLKQIKSTYGVYAVEGNHELYTRKYNFDFFEASNILLLRDTIYTISSSFQIIGRKDRHDKARMSLNELLEKSSDSLTSFLLNHQPYHLDSVYNHQHNVDVQFSGHTHYGQLFPFNLIIENMFELSWGYRKIENSHFFVTCGAQGWGPQVKTASQSEIMKINIEFID